MRPRKPKLTPVERLPYEAADGKLIPPAEMRRQVLDMERYATYALQQAINIADELMLPHAMEQNYAQRKAEMQTWFSVAGAIGGYINARVNAFKFAQEVDNGNFGDGDWAGYAAARRGDAGQHR